jgi:hypothetical protein
MNAARSMWGWTLPSPARRPIEWTQTVGGAAVEALAVTASQDRPVVVFADVEVDGAGRSRDERDRRRGKLTVFHPGAEQFDVRACGLQ